MRPLRTIINEFFLKGDDDDDEDNDEDDDEDDNASMMIFYLGKETNDGLELDFVFSIGNLNNEDGIIPRNELEIIDKGARQAEKLINWMVPNSSRKSDFLEYWLCFLPSS